MILPGRRSAYPETVWKGNATPITPDAALEQMRPLFEQMLTQAGSTPVKQLPGGSGIPWRTGDEGAYEFYLNYGTSPALRTGSGIRIAILTGSEVSDQLYAGRLHGAAVVRSKV